MLIFTIFFLGLCKLKPEMVCTINNYLLINFFKKSKYFSYFILYYKIDEECADPRDWYYFNNVECQRIFTCSSLLFPSKEECMETCNNIISSLFTGTLLQNRTIGKFALSMRECGMIGVHVKDSYLVHIFLVI